MKTFDVVLIIITIALIGWVFFLRDDMLDGNVLLDERFAGSDWNTAFWGQSLWTGWNYGSAPPRGAPRPEDTTHIT